MAYGLIAHQHTAIALMPLDKAATEHKVAESSPSVTRQCTHASFNGSWGQHALIHDQEGQIQEVWVGQEGQPDDPRAWLFLFAELSAKLPAGTYAMDAFSLDPECSFQAAIGWGLAHYDFNRYKSAESIVRPDLCLPDSISLTAVTAQLDSIFLARDLVNEPASSLGPSEMADVAQLLANEYQAKLSTIRGTDLLKEGYPAVHAVGRGSIREPVLIDMVWGDPQHPKLTLVGKGVVFDTGGLNMKGASGMRNMKKDKGGAALVLALAKWIMASNLPVRLRVLVPAVENSPGNGAYRPGDVIETRKGLHVEIHNTDAEGRVILCDALCEAVSENPDLIIDMATLTGAARVALGPDLPVFYTPNKSLATALNQAADKVADPIWQLPLWSRYRSYLDSHIADMLNSSTTSFGGSITAALYLHEFVKPFENWIHFDIYAWNPNAAPGAPVGGEASAFRALAAFLQDRFTNS